jgi:hypothetical protein
VILLGNERMWDVSPECNALMMQFMIGHCMQKLAGGLIFGDCPKLAL